MEIRKSDLFISAAKIKEYATRSGFDDCGICKAEINETEKNYFLNWLKNGYHGSMNYLAQTEKRFNPELIFPEIKSVVVLLLSYNTNASQNVNSHYKISKYAYSQDYHALIKQKLIALQNMISKDNCKIETFSFVDSSAVWEKIWAKKSGIASIGKHSIAINKKLGSFCFIGGLFLNATTEYDAEAEDLCGNCKLCIDNCPTKAIISPHVVDVRKCIAYHTIENKSDIPIEFKGLFQNQIYGCDICQDVCPYNNKKPTKNHFVSNEQILKLTKQDWESMNEGDFISIFNYSSIKRLGFLRLKRNILFVNK